MLTKTLLRISFSVIGRCSLVPTSHWLQGKCSRIKLSPAAFGIILQNHSWLPLSIFSVKIAFKICKSFQRSKLNLWVWFFHSSKKQKIVKTINACTESTFYQNKHSKKLFISWHNPLKRREICKGSAAKLYL